jgi:hypothetical protein
MGRGAVDAHQAQKEAVHVLPRPVLAGPAHGGAAVRLRQAGVPGRAPKETQRRWRQAHPEDATARRYRAALAATKAGQAPALPRAPPARIDAFPWEEARDEIPAQVFVTFGFFSHLAAGLARDVIRAEVPRITEEIRHYVAAGLKDETAGAVPAG